MYRVNIRCIGKFAFLPCLLLIYCFIIDYLSNISESNCNLIFLYNEEWEKQKYSSDVPDASNIPYNFTNSLKKKTSIFSVLFTS